MIINGHTRIGGGKFGKKTRTTNVLSNESCFDRVVWWLNLVVYRLLHFLFSFYSCRPCVSINAICSRRLERHVFRSVSRDRGYICTFDRRCFLYRLVLQKINKIWAGVGFGLGLWLIVFYVLNPIFPGLKSVQNLDLNTIITSICLYVLYGTFIGYSISYEYAEQQRNV